MDQKRLILFINLDHDNDWTLKDDGEILSNVGIRKFKKIMDGIDEDKIMMNN